MKRVAPYLGGIVMGLLLAFIRFADTSPVQQDLGIVVHVTPRAFGQLEPTSHPSTLSKITRPVAKLEQRVVADGAGGDMLGAFVAAAEKKSRRFDRNRSKPEKNQSAVNNAAPNDSAASDRSKNFPRLALGYGGEIWPRRLDLFTLTSDAAKERLTYKACGHVSWRMVGDSAVVQGGRFCWFDDVAGFAGAGALGYGIASRDPKVIAAGTVLLIIRRVVSKRPP